MIVLTFKCGFRLFTSINCYKNRSDVFLLSHDRHTPPSTDNWGNNIYHTAISHRADRCHLKYNFKCYNLRELILGILKVDTGNEICPLCNILTDWTNLLFKRGGVTLCCLKITKTLVREIIVGFFCV